MSDDAGVVTPEILREAMRLLYESGGKLCNHVVHPNEPGAVFGGVRYAVCANCFEPFVVKAKQKAEL